MEVTEKTKVKQIIKMQNTQQKSLWEQMINGIVRPPRANYRQLQLCKQYNVSETIYKRRDQEINHDGLTLKVTIYEPQFRNQALVIYLHGNSSSRLQCFSILRFLPRRFSLAAFDFLGCGLNQELDSISLGKRESEQVQTVSEYFRSKGYDVIIWGRSMGAASALRYGKADIIVADSSFKSLRCLCKQIAKNQTPIPNFLISCCFPCVFIKLKKDVKQAAQYDMDQVDIKKAVKNIHPSTTVIFLSGDNDKLIDQRNSQKLYNLFPGQNKYIEIFEGNHNSRRPQAVLMKVMDIVRKQYELKKQLGTWGAWREKKLTNENIK